MSVTEDARFANNILACSMRRAGVISVRRYAERLLERPAEIVRTQANKLRESPERYLLGEVLLDVGRNRPLLPGSEAAPSGRSDAWGPGVETHEFMCQDGAESFEIGAAVGACTLDQPLELERRVPQCGVLEEQPRHEDAGAVPVSGCVGILAGSK